MILLQRNQVSKQRIITSTLASSIIEFLASIFIHNVSDLRGSATGKKDFEEVKSANVYTVSKTTEWMHFSASITLFNIFNSCSKLTEFHQYLSHLKLKLHSESAFMESPHPKAFFFILVSSLVPGILKQNPK